MHLKHQTVIFTVESFHLGTAKPGPWCFGFQPERLWDLSNVLNNLGNAHKWNDKLYIAYVCNHASLPQMCHFTQKGCEARN